MADHQSTPRADESAIPLGYECPDIERPASASPTAADLETEIPGAIDAQHDPYAALRFRDFRYYLAGWIAGVIAQQIQEVAVGWDIYSRTKNEVGLDPLLALGLVGGVIALPIIVLAIPAGSLADRFDRRKIVMLSLTGTALSWLVLAWLSRSHGSLGMMYFWLFAGACSSAMGWPARSALVPQIVAEGCYSNAVTWNATAFQISSMAGPALGGLILYWSHPHPYPAYLVAAGFLLLFVTFLAMLHTRPPKRQPVPLNFETVAAGFRFVFRTKIILATLTLDLFAVLLGGATALLPKFADILHVQSRGFGLLRSAPAFGALLTGILIAHMPPMKKAGRNLLLAVAGFGLATIVFGLSQNFMLSFFMLLLTGAFDNVSVVVRHTLVQVLTPDAMRGRVSAVNNVFVGASNELGGLESGLTGAWLGAVKSVVIGGIATLGVVAAVAGIWPQVARFGSLEEARPVEEENAR